MLVCFYVISSVQNKVLYFKIPHPKEQYSEMSTVLSIYLSVTRLYLINPYIYIENRSLATVFHNCNGFFTPVFTEPSVPRVRRTGRVFISL